MSDLMDALMYGAEALAKPGRAVRGAIAGRPDEILSAIPFSDALGITDPSRAVWGRDLLGQSGISTGSDLGDAIAGFGVDLVTDPLLYFGPGLMRGALGSFRGSRALGVGAGENVDDALTLINAGRERTAQELAGAGFGDEVAFEAGRAAHAAEYDDLMRQADQFIGDTRAAFPGADLGAVDDLAGLNAEELWRRATAGDRDALMRFSQMSADDARASMDPAFAASREADRIFGFPFSGRASDPYGHGSIFHDMMAESVSPLERQMAITSAWDEALGRIPQQPAEVNFFSPGYSAEARSAADAARESWQNAYSHPLMTRLAELTAFDEAARTGLYGDSAAISPLLESLAGQRAAIQGVGRWPAMEYGGVGGARELYESTGGTHHGINALQRILMGDTRPDMIGQVVTSPATSTWSTPRREIAALFGNSPLAPELGAAKSIAGNARVDQLRARMLEHAEEVAQGRTYNEFGDIAADIATPAQQRDLALNYLRQYTRQDKIPFVKGAVRGDDAAAAALRELYEFAGQTPPKWAMPKAIPTPATEAAMPVHRMPFTSEGPTLTRMPPTMQPAPLPPHGSYYSPYTPPPGFTQADIPLIADIEYPFSHPDYWAAFNRAAKQRIAERIARGG